HHALDRGQQEDQSRPALARHASESEDNASLVLAQHPHRHAREHERGYREADEGDDEREDHAINSHFSARRTERVRPLTRSTTTGSPSWSAPPSASAHPCWARHSAPSTNTWPPDLLHRRTTPTRPHNASAPAWMRARRESAALRVATSAHPPAAAPSPAPTGTATAAPPPSAAMTTMPPAISATPPDMPRTPPGT